MRPLIVIPTYNERRNLALLVPRIFSFVRTASILVVDDSSPDGTAAQARTLSRKYRGRIHVLSRPGKQGLGSAYVAGFRWALARNYDPVIQMDADGSHDPAALPAFLTGLRKHDAVVSSRYLRGLRVINWPWHRLMLSMWANRYARLVTGTPLTDLTGGFNGWRRALLARIRPETLRCGGYAFQIELKHRARLAAARFQELPIVFAGRVEGESKLSRSVVGEAIWAVWRMRFGGQA